MADWRNSAAGFIIKSQKTGNNENNGQKAVRSNYLVYSKSVYSFIAPVTGFMKRLGIWRLPYTEYPVTSGHEPANQKQAQGDVHQSVGL